MENEYRCLYDKLLRDMDNTANDVLNKLASNLSSLLMTMSEREKELSLDTITNPQLQRIYMVAFEHEQYEVCQAIKKKIEREPSKTQ